MKEFQLGSVFPDRNLNRFDLTELPSGLTKLHMNYILTLGPALCTFPCLKSLNVTGKPDFHVMVDLSYIPQLWKRSGYLVPVLNGELYLLH